MPDARARIDAGLARVASTHPQFAKPETRAWSSKECRGSRSGSRSARGALRPIATQALRARLGDTEEMGFYENEILPRLINVAMSSRELAPIRARVNASLEGEVLEVGFGSGLNVPHYPSSVTRVTAIDPSTVGRKLAAARVTARGIPLEYVGADGEALPLASASIDHVITTWTLCSIPDADRALAEIRRVLRPGGSFHFVEHGRSPDRSVAAWQDRLTPIQRRIAGGCHLNRPIDQLVRNAGLELAQLDNYYVKGLRPLGYMFEGVATKS